MYISDNLADKGGGGGRLLMICKLRLKVKQLGMSRKYRCGANQVCSDESSDDAEQGRSGPETARHGNGFIYKKVI